MDVKNRLNGKLAHGGLMALAMSVALLDQPVRRGRRLADQGQGRHQAKRHRAKRRQAYQRACRRAGRRLPPGNWDQG